jgi:DNA-binding LytR/AlgR family response regulator
MTCSCLIIDDEPPAIRVLEKYIERAPQLRLAASFHDAISAAAFLRTQPVELLFLDIHLPELSGISFLRTLTDPPPVIFTTAYPQYAVEGFELQAIDYLVKPISFERFLRAVNRFLELQEQRQRLRQPPSPSAPPAPLLIRADRRLHRLDPDDIRYLQAYGDYVKIVTRQGNITPKAKLQDLEAQLPPAKFIRIHRSYIISLTAVTYIEGNHVHLTDENLPIGQSYREELMERMAGKG